MKKIVASVGLVALGASAIQSACAQDLGTPDTSKPWSISVALRGFYDDNPGTLPNDTPTPAGYHRSSFGFQVSPQAALAWSVENTTVSLGVLYSMIYYENKPVFSTSHIDQDFTFTGNLTHDFSEQLHARVTDSFVIGQEPDMLRAGNAFSTFYRVSGDNIRNYGTIALDAQLTPVFGLSLGYDNAYYHYVANGATAVPVGPFEDVIQPSIAGVLNRDENRAHIEGTFQLQPETKALLGYQFSDFDYMGDEYIGGFIPAFGPPVGLITSRMRDNREHTVYVGIEHNFLPNLTAAVRAGGSYTDYYNDPSTKASYTPYVNATLKYTYAPGSFIEGGFSYDRNATDIVGFSFNGTGSDFTTDAESAVVFLTLQHQLLGNLFLNLNGQFQNSIYNGGAFNNDAEQFYMAGIDLQYRFTAFFSGDVGYSYDRLESSIMGRAFDENRVYVGVTATY
ncbi:MAG TPA: outer membrane beta-barrel protein [Verrucomicrobiae bacterium]|nr:outer membrane beta-barrel protein [Verrucomicrobiae bacterium]